MHHFNYVSTEDKAGFFSEEIEVESNVDLAALGKKLIFQARGKVHSF